MSSHRAKKQCAIENKTLLAHLPYYNCKVLISVHPLFNNLIDDNRPSRKSLDSLNSLYDLSVFQLNSLDKDIDPDRNFHSNKICSKYYSPHSFAQFIKNKQLQSKISDHFSQMCITTSQCKIFFQHNKTKVRDYSTFKTKCFINDLQNINWTSVCKQTDPNQSFSRFYKFINKTINEHAPLRCISNRKQKLLAKPWLTVGLRKLIRIKNALFLTSHWDKYKFYRNKIISLTRLSKANYYQSFFYLNIRNVRQTWKGINELIGSCKKKNKRNPIYFIRSNPNEVPTSDLREISDILNRYFTTVGRKLASKNSSDHKYIL